MDPIRLHHRHAAVETRNRFLPPRYLVLPVESNAVDEESIPPVPLLTDLRGEEIPGRSVTLRLGHDGRAFIVKARVEEDRPVVRPEWDASHRDFWRQDHIEFRLIPDPDRDLEQVQVIMAASGKAFLSGPGTNATEISCSAEMGDGFWTVNAVLPFSALGLPALGDGDVLKGLLARTRWGDGSPEFACCTAAQLGFPHAERFAELLIRGERPSVTLEGVRPSSGVLPRGSCPASVELRNATGEHLKGRLLLKRDRGPELPGETTSRRCELSPGMNTAELDLELERPLYNRYHVSFAPDANRAVELGAVTLRAGVPCDHGLNVGKLTHPYLLFDSRGLESLRRKADQEFFQVIVESIREPWDDSRDDLPESIDELALELTPKCGNWLRVARESMLGREGGPPTGMARIWEMLSAEAQEALREIDRTALGSDEALDTALSGFNALLSRRDFYDAEAFALISLPEETRTALTERRDALSDRELFLHNRTVFQCAVECVREFRIDLASRAAGQLSSWVLDGDEQRIRFATRCLAAADACMITNPHIDLHTGGISSSLALSFDAFEPHLTSDEREIWLRVLRRFLRLYLNTARGVHWNTTAIPNANPVCNGGGGLLALALLAEFPEEASEALHHARRHIWNWLDYCTGSDGGNTEGAQYWQYGTENFLPFAAALERVFGNDDGLLSHPGIVNCMNMLRVSLCNDGCLHGFNDTIPLPVGGPIAWFCAGRFDDAFGLWYGDHALRVYKARMAEGKPTPYKSPDLWGLLVRPERPEATEQPPLPTVMVQRDIQYSIMRSSTRYDCALAAGLKGSRPPYTHHNQPDTGSYFLNVRGERLLIDPGYYKSGPELHNLPIVDGAAPKTPDGYVGRLIAHGEVGDVRYLACDSAAAYRGAAKRLVRHLVMIGEEGWVLLDDIAVPKGAEGKVLAQYQCGGETKDHGGGRDILIQGHHARLRLQVLTRPDLRLKLDSERSLHDSHWGYHFADCRHFPATGTYRVDREDPLVTVFTDVTDDHSREASLRRENGSLLLTLASGRELCFLRGATGWHPEPFV